MINWTVDPVAFHIFSRGIRYYGLLYVVAIWGGYQLWQWQIMRSGRSYEQAERFMGMGVAAVIVGARIGHCLFYHPSYYLAQPWRIVKVWEGGLASHGATVTLLLILAYYAKTEGMKIREVLDRFACAVAWGASIIRLGNLMNSEVVGRPWTGSFSFKFPIFDRGQLRPCDPSAGGECVPIPYLTENPRLLPGGFDLSQGGFDLSSVPARHPSQIYEFLMGMVILGVLLLVDRSYGEKRPIGLLGGLFLLLYFSARFTVEFFKDYQADGIESGLTMGQYLSLPFMTIGLGLVLYALRRTSAAEAA
ncbi:MAG: prolipoprotein diacylglyceryl transferase [Myxococcota bacterium]|nr:prolipoprotein diacylglyceryl transferase [Myxococcota bacterium]